MIRNATSGIAGLALGVLGNRTSVLGQESPPSSSARNAFSPHFRPRAKAVIYLSMSGGPSHVDTFDYKPLLRKNDGKSAKQVVGGTASRLARKGMLWGSPWPFRRHGRSGLPISDLFPHVARHADNLCLLNGMHTDVSGHALATQMQFTGSFQFTRPSLGSWLLYGLGSESSDVPGFVSLRRNEFGPAFLPSRFQPTMLDARGGLRNVRNGSMSRSEQRRQLDVLAEYNRLALRENPAVQEALDGLQSDFEMAFRMQTSLPDILDTGNASPKLLEEYGINGTRTRGFGLQCLIARRLIERGVRFVQLESGGWDQHHTLEENLATQCEATDRPIAALLSDLKRRGLLDQTLVIWGGEFGRTPFSEDWSGARPRGRDHNALGYSMWVAGGGVRGGIRYGKTDELGSQAVENRMHLHDLHATVLHQLGLDHTRLTFRYGGRDYRITDVHGEVAHSIIS